MDEKNLSMDAQSSRELSRTSEHANEQGPASIVQMAGGALSAMQSTFVLRLSGGHKAVPNMMGKAMMVHTGKGIVYFQPNKETLYEVVEVSWDGPRYQQKQITDVKRKSKGKTGRRGRLGGALVGGMLVPIAGTVIGAAVGTGKKTKEVGTERSETYVQRMEVPAPCTIVLEKLSTREEVTIVTDVMSDKAPDLLSLVHFDEEDLEPTSPAELAEPSTDEIATSDAAADRAPGTATTSVADVYDELKKAKELLDLGILTQEEFDARKAALLK